MEYTSLGRSGLQVSRLCLGTMNFGMVADESTSFSILDQALKAGINFIDTADVYGGPQSPDMEQGYGSSEEIIGRWLAQDGRRERIVLATKVYQPMGTGPNDRRLSAIKRECIWHGPIYRKTGVLVDRRNSIVGPFRARRRRSNLFD
jgi:aryl-alcohol dehydrogenase-like predicted oxidoreductase